jgi:integrase
MTRVGRARPGPGHCRSTEDEAACAIRASGLGEGSLLSWPERRGGKVDDDAFPSRIDHSAHLSTRQYARFVYEWVTAIGLRREDYGTRSLLRTKASIIYKATGNLRAAQILLGHTKIESTVRYLGVDVEDALAPAEATEV